MVEPVQPASLGSWGAQAGLGVTVDPTKPGWTTAEPGVRPAGAIHARVGALVSAARPRQWVKSGLVFAAPIAALAAGQRVDIAGVVVAGLLFCAISSGIYMLNDAADCEADRRHPRKSLRPVASGRISRNSAAAAGAVLVLMATGTALGAGMPALGEILAVYAGVNLAYSLGLKRVPLLELLCVSAGFVLRAVAGGAAGRIPISGWFLLVVCSGSLLVAVGKRTAEIATLPGEGRSHRAVLRWYRLPGLALMRYLFATVTVVAYGGWTLTRLPFVDDPRGDWPLLAVSLVPFTVAVVAIERALAKGQGGAPEEIPFKSRLLQGAAAAWLMVFVLAAVT